MRGETHEQPVLCRIYDEMDASVEQRKGNKLDNAFSSFCVEISVFLLEGCGSAVKAGIALGSQTCEESVLHYWMDGGER